MGLIDYLKLDVSDFFTTSKTRALRRQCAFHIKNSEKFLRGAFNDDEDAWLSYFAELAKAITADTTTIEARWLRSKALDHWFSLYRSHSAHEPRQFARAWDRDVQYMLTNWPKSDPEGMSLEGARDMRMEFDRRCRGLGLG
jgi:hypothetical protein